MNGDLKRTAVFNGIFANHPLYEGQLIKVAIRESYRPQSELGAARPRASDAPVSRTDSD